MTISVILKSYNVIKRGKDMANKRISGFNKRMQQFTEISFSTQKFLCSVNIVVKVDGQQVEYYKKHVTGELKPFYEFGDKSDFLEAFSCLQVGKWKKRYAISERSLNLRNWELSIKFSDGKQITYSGKNAYPENFSALDKLLRTDYAI